MTSQTWCASASRSSLTDDGLLSPSVARGLSGGEEVGHRVRACATREHPIAVQSCQKLGRIGVERSREPNDRVQLGVGFAAFDASVVRDVHICQIGDVFLTEPESQTSLTHAVAEKLGGTGTRGWHTS